MPAITWLEPIPDGYDPSTQRVQWMDLVDDMPSENDGIWVMTRGEDTTGFLFQKGVTHLSNYSLAGLPNDQVNAIGNSGHSYNEVPKTDAQLALPDRGAGTWVPSGQGWPNIWNTRFFDYTPGQTEPLTPQQGTDKGNQYTTFHALVVFENSENDHAVGTQWGFWRTYYAAYSARMNAQWNPRGIQWYVAHNYFTGYGGARNGVGTSKYNNYGEMPLSLGGSSRSQHKAQMLAAVTEYPGSELQPGGTLYNTNLTCFGIYLGAPDTVEDKGYQMIYDGYVAHKAGKFTVAFIQAFYEWRPNNYQATYYPEGTFYRKDKQPHNPTSAITYSIISRVFMDGMIPFSSGGKSTAPFTYSYQYWGPTGQLDTSSQWWPTGATSPGNINDFPYWSMTTAQNFITMGLEDCMGFGMSLYSKTFGQTKGGVRKFVRFRQNSGGWIDPSTNEVDNVIDAYFDKRAIVFTEVLGNQMSVLYYNPYGTNQSVNLEFQHPTNSSITYTCTVASTMAHVTRFTI